MNKKTSQRIIEIDLLRGLAVIGMIVYHFFFVLDYFSIKSVSIQTGGWMILARAIQFTFLIIVGISLSISAKKRISSTKTRAKFYLHHWRRGGIILAFGFLITIVTTLLVPDVSIRFGILHLIGTSIILAAPFARSRYLALIFSIAIFAAAPGIASIISDNSLLYPVGATIRNTSGSLDYFPLFPWLGLIFFGIALGNSLYRTPKSKLPPNLPLPKQLTQFIFFNSKHALIIYLLHVPIIIMMLLLTMIINPNLVQ